MDQWKPYTYYEVLGVSALSPPWKIDQSYKQKKKLYINRDEWTREIVIQAHKILSDDHSRLHYDAFLATGALTQRVLDGTAVDLITQLKEAVKKDPEKYFLPYNPEIRTGTERQQPKNRKKPAYNCRRCSRNPLKCKCDIWHRCECCGEYVALYLSVNNIHSLLSKDGHSHHIICKKSYETYMLSGRWRELL